MLIFFPFATVKIIGQTNGSVTDGEGNFILRISSLKNTDTIIISSVGFENLKLPAAKALKKHEFILTAFTKKIRLKISRMYQKHENRDYRDSISAGIISEKRE